MTTRKHTFHMNRRMPKAGLVVLVITFLMSIAHSASATTIHNFIFSGVITFFEATREFDGQVVPLPNLANPGDHFTGTASFNSATLDQFPSDTGFNVSVNGYTWGGPGAPYSFLTSTEIFIEVPEGTGAVPYTIGVAILSASLTSSSGSFQMFGLSSNSTVSNVGGDITSFHAVPDPGSSVTLIGIGFMSLVVMRRKFILRT